MKEKIKNWCKKRKHRFLKFDEWFVECFYYYSAFLTVGLILNGGFSIVLGGWAIAFIMFIGQTAGEEMRKQWEQAKEKDKEGEKQWQ